MDEAMNETKPDAQRPPLSAVLESELDWARRNSKLQLVRGNDQGAQYWEGVAHGLVRAINAVQRSNVELSGHQRPAQEQR